MEYSDEKVEQDAKQLTDWKNPPRVSDLKADYKEAYNSHSAHVTMVDEWLSCLEGTLPSRVKIKPGRSEVQPKVVRKQAEWRYSALEEPFLSGEDIFRVRPVTAFDVEAAKQNQLILNKQFAVDIPRVNFINRYIREAVNTGTAIIKVSWETKSDLVREEVEVPIYASSEQELTQFIQAQIQSGAMAQEEAQALLQSGQPIPIGSEMQEQEVEKEYINRPVLQIKDSRDVIIDPTCEGDLSKANFIIDTYYTDLATLKEDGRYSNLEYISSSSYNATNDGDLHYHDTDSISSTSYTFKDKPRQKLRAYEYWGYWDINGDSTVKPIVATYIGDVMVRLEENPYPDKELPFTVVQYLPPNTNGVYGVPDASLLKENQEIIGATTRGIIDLLGRSANAQRGTSMGFLDPVNKKKFNSGDDFEFNSTNGRLDSHYFMTTYPEIPRSAFELINSQSAEAEALTGIKAFSQGISGDSLGSSVGGIKSAMDATAKREAGILRRLAQGLTDVARKIISMNSVFLSDEEIIRITDDEHVTIKRDDLAGDFDLTITVSTAEENNQKAQELSFMLQTMGNSMPFEMSQLVLAKIADLRKVPDLAKMIREYQPQPDPIAQEAAQLQNELMKAQIADYQAKAAENSIDIELKTAKTATEQAKARQLGGKSDLDDLKFVEQAMGIEHDRSLEKDIVKEEARAANKPQPTKEISNERIR